MPSPSRPGQTHTRSADLRKQFLKTFDDLARHRERHEVLTDFLEMAVCAIRKETVPPGSAADALEERYMAVVKRNRPDDVQVMPQLLGITAMALQEGGSDFLGQVVMELELPNAQMGQFFTPYDLSRTMAEMQLRDAPKLIEEKGFITLMEPASGAGGMIIAAADVIAQQGIDIGQHLYVDATDVSPMCFKMTYLQVALRGIPATIRRGNSLSLEMFDQAITPAFLPFYATHRTAFDGWRQPACTPVPSPRSGTPSDPPPDVSPVPISEVRTEQIERARSVVEIATVQNRYNLADRRHHDVLTYCERHGMGFIAFYPLGAGTLAMSAALGPIGARTGATSSQIALAWLLQRSPATILIPGTSSVKHLEQNVAARDLRLTSNEMIALEQIGPPLTK